LHHDTIDNRQVDILCGLDTGVQIHAIERRSAMIRVTKTEEQSRTIITIDGQLSGDSVAVVEACCKQAKPNGKPVELFLRDVTTVDQTGQILLSRLAAIGVRLVARGVYTSYLVQSLTSGKAVPDDPPVENHRRLS
jgi:hypothetical protein